MAKPVKTSWGTGDPSYIIQPSAGKQALGWQPGEKPPAQYMNWQHNEVANWETYFENKTENIEPITFRSDSSLTWNGSQLSFASAIELHFRVKAGVAQINRFTAGVSPIALSDGQVVIIKRDKTGASPVNLSSGTYGSLSAGSYVIVAESSLTLADIENEMIFLRRRGSNLEIPYLGVIVPSGKTFSFGLTDNPTTAADVSVTDSGNYFAGTNVETVLQEIGLALSSGATGTGPFVKQSSPTIITPTIASFVNANHSHLNAAGGGTLDAAAIASGTFANARISQASVTQHEAAFALAASQITSGTFANARIQQSNVTQHQAALTILETQITDGSLLARLAANETVPGIWDFSGNPLFSNGLRMNSGEKFIIDNTTGQESWIEGGNSGINGSFMSFYANSVYAFGFDGSDLTTSEFSVEGDTIPATDNAWKLGDVANRWTEVWALDGSINTSDRRQKMKIKACDLGLDFLMELDPVSFEWKLKKDGRRNYGFISQQVRAALGNKNFGGIREEGDVQGLAYDQFFAPVVMSIQELNRRLKKLEARVK